MMDRRLAAILAADVVGYSRLVGRDEEGAIARLHRILSETVIPCVTEGHGRVVKTMGDGLLAEFPSVVDAVRVAQKLQRAVALEGEAVPEDDRILFRVGVNLGDVIVKDGDILGEGVNVAARLEALSEPGGVCVSRSVRDHVRDRLPLVFEDMGEVEVKNIDRPVRVFRLREDGFVQKTAGPRPLAKRAGIGRTALLAGVVVALASGGTAYWWRAAGPPGPAALGEFSGPALPDRPSIAVLPFENLGGESEQRYFADGITEDITTDLSGLSGLFVVARDSAFAFREAETPASLSDVSRALGVRYVLEGSVRRIGDRVRINAQLVDAESGRNVWAERYDGTFSDVFALQDRVTGRIVDALAVELTPSEQMRQARAETDSPEAYDAFLRGWAYYRRGAPDDFAHAIPHLQRALEIDPDYARAHAVLAAIYWSAIERNVTGRGGLWAERLGLTHEASRRKAEAELARALENPTPLALMVASGVRTHQGRHEEAVAQARAALELDPNDPAAHEALARALIYAGRPAEGATAVREAMRLDPRFASRYLPWLGLAQFGMERYAEAAETLSEALLANPEDDTAMIALIAAYGHLGRTERAEDLRRALDDLRTRREERLEQIDGRIRAGIDTFLLGPYTLDDVNLWPFRESADRERLRAGLRAAGVPETAAEGTVSPSAVDGAVTVDAAEARRLHDAGAPFVDVRTHARWSLGHVPGATLLDFEESFTEASLSAVAAKDRPVVIYCEGPRCLRSSEASRRAVSWGFTEVRYFRGGFPDWKAAGNPVAVE